MLILKLSYMEIHIKMFMGNVFITKWLQKAGPSVLITCQPFKYNLR